MELLPWFETTDLYCTVVRRHVTLRFLTYDGRHPMGVLACSAFEDPTTPTCGTPCVRNDADLLTTGVRCAE